MGNKLVLALTIALSMFLLGHPATVSAQNIAGHSALIIYPNKPVLATMPVLKKKLIIKRMLDRYNSPLKGDVDAFVESCQTYVLDCYLLPSITGLESYFGRYTHPNSNNPFGWGGGYIMFASYREAIKTVAQGLRQNYADRGAITVDQIGPIYAESKTWAQRVNHFMNLFDQEEEKLNLFLTENPVNL